MWDIRGQCSKKKFVGGLGGANNFTQCLLWILNAFCTNFLINVESVVRLEFVRICSDKALQFVIGEEYVIYFIESGFADA